MARVDELNRILRTLQSGTPDIEASALITEDGLIIGTVCVVDLAPRALAPREGEALRMLARRAMGQLELRRASRSHRTLLEINNAIAGTGTSYVTPTDFLNKLEQAEKGLGFDSASWRAWTDGLPPNWRPSPV